MEGHNYNTESLWKSFLTLIFLLLIIGLGALSYLLLADTIGDYLSRTVYTEDQLEELTKRRLKIQKQDRADNWDLIENGIHVKTGLRDGEHLQLVITQCTSCHSAKLITQNRATRQGWKDMIEWMQTTQGLQDLGSHESKIITYLTEHYAPQEVGRRQNLNIEAIEWYVLDLPED